MEQKLLALDISTSTVGVSVWVDGELMEVTHLSPAIKHENKRLELYQKSILIASTLKEKYPLINTIAIEEPLITSATIQVATLLNYFAGLMYAALKSEFKDIEIIYYNLDTCRRTALPELVGGKKNTLWGAIPEKIAGCKKSDFRKDIIMYLVAQRYPAVEWKLNNNSNIDTNNYDRADSIVVGLCHFITVGMLDGKPQNIEKCIEYLENLADYQIFLKESKKVKEKDKKNDFKLRYLSDIFEINKYLNVRVEKVI